jgi:hypothetical protein
MNWTDWTVVPAGTVLLTLPGALQLGVGSASKGSESDGTASGEAGRSSLSVLLDATPAAMRSLRLGISLWSEIKRGAASPFAPYLDLLPETLSCCLAPGYTAEASEALRAWPPTAARVTAMRAALRAQHATLRRAAAVASVEAPTLDELGWASAIAGSRAYRVRGSRGQAGDSACLLPIIDLANYAPSVQANAELRNAPTGEALGASADPLAVSLYASRDLQAGTEVLIDYGSGTPLTNERLLLEYGFVLPPDRGSLDSLELPFGAIAVGMQAIAGAEGEASAVGAADGGAGAAEATTSEGDHRILLLRQQQLLAELGDIERAGLVFAADGAPNEATHALALILAARRSGELPPGLSASDLVASARAGTAPKAAAAGELALRARRALHAVVRVALEELLAGAAGDPRAEVGAVGFEAAARDFCETRRVILERACERLSSA